MNSVARDIFFLGKYSISYGEIFRYVKFREMKLEPKALCFVMNKVHETNAINTFSKTV